MQETFLRAFEKRHSFRGDSSPATWLHRILHNLAIDRSRRLGREVVTAEVEERWRDDAYTVDSATVIERACSAPIADEPGRQSHARRPGMREAPT